MSTAVRNRILVRSEEQPTFFFAGATIKFVSTPEDTQADLFLMEASLLPGTVVPLHKHPDPEVFHMLEGELEVYVDAGPHSGWRTTHPGEMINIARDVKHAFRNLAGGSARLLMASGKNMYAFFRESVVPFDPNKPPAPPDEEQLQMMRENSIKHHHWMADAEENAAIGLRLQRPG